MNSEENEHAKWRVCTSTQHAHTIRHSVDGIAIGGGKFLHPRFAGVERAGGGRGGLEGSWDECLG